MIRNFDPGRRSFLKIVASVGIDERVQSRKGLHVPWSAGSETPRNQALAGATDCHHHIYDSRFPVDPLAKLRPGDATVAAYRLLQQRIGTSRNVVVQPSTYGVDNRCLVDALRQFGTGLARGIAVVNTEVQDRALKELRSAGVCGIRFNLVQAGATTLEMVEPLAKRAADLGWHVQVNASKEQIAAAADLWNRLPVPLVFDHMGHLQSAQEDAFGVLAGLLQGGKGWVKLSGVYMDTKVGPPTYADRAAVAMAFIKEAPDRLVWGTDWPHPTANDKPDDALLFDLLKKWSLQRSTWAHILVQNPATLYGFPMH